MSSSGPDRGIQNNIDRLQGGNFIDVCDTDTEVLDCPDKPGNDNV